MQNSFLHGCLSVAIALACGVTVASAKAASIPQFVAQKSPGEILLAQSVDEEVKVQFESRGCRRTKPTQVSCDILITNIGETRQYLSFYSSGHVTNAVDSSGNVHAAKIVQYGPNTTQNPSSGGSIGMSIAPGIPTKVTFIFEMPQEVTELAALDLGYSLNEGGWVPRKRIAISNIGAIASQSNSAPPRRRVGPR